MELNKIYLGDCLELMKQLPNDSIDVIITSPPYNKAGYLGKVIEKKDNLLWNVSIDYGGDSSIDFKDEEQYQQGQIDFLNECHRVIKRDGSIFYNHKIRVNRNVASNPYSWIEKSKLTFRQMIVWDRGSTPQMNSSRYMHTTELIFWLSKDDSPLAFSRSKDCLFKGEVWRISPRVERDHPAPFPIEIPNNILDCIPHGDRIVLDPYCGLGTTLVSAKRHNFNYIGFDCVEKYINLANKWIEEENTIKKKLW